MTRRTSASFLMVSGALLGCSMLTNPSLAAEQALESNIKSVKLYRSEGAVVTRTGSVTLGQGAHTITVTGLPEDIDTNYGIRAVLPAGAGTISDVRIERVFTVQSVAEEQKKIQADIDALEAKVEENKAELDALNLEFTFLSKLGGDEAPASSSTLGFLRENAKRITEARLNLNRATKEAQQKIIALQRQLQQTGASRESTVTAVISLTKATDAAAPLSFTYLLEDARWDMSLDANVDSAAAQATVSLSATIEQTTGEDWTNVPVQLSTSKLNYQLGADLPAPIYQNIQDPNVRLKEARLQRSTFAADAAEEVVVTGARLTQSTFEAEFTPSSPVTLVSDGSARTIPLVSETVPLKLKARITPQQNSSAYLYGTATFKDLPSITGATVTLVRDGQYLGDGLWPDLEKDSAVELPLGFIEQIKVETITLPSEDGESGIFDRKIVDETKRQYKIKNNLQQAYSIEVFDALPQSMNEDLEIRTLRSSTSYSEQNVNGQPGLVMWRKTVKPGEEWQINHWLRTSYPQDKVLVREWR